MMPQPHTSSLPSSLAPPSAGAPPMFSSEGLTTASGGGTGQGQQQLAISNGVLLAAVIFLFMVVVFVFLLYLYAKRYLGANPLLAPRPSSPSSRFVFVSASPLPQRGLPAAVLRSLPVTVFKEEEGEKEEGSLECAVCLSEVAGGEKVRALPKCAHAFHVECIDMWFHSHDTCPLCRAPVVALDALPREDPTATEFPAAFPTNVLFWGTHDDVTNAGGLSTTPAPPLPAPSTAASSSASARSWNKESLVIDIPARAVSMTTPPTTSPLPSSRMPGLSADDMRSPVSARLRSLRRLLSRGKQAMVGTSYSPRGDIEQGSEAGRQLPKTPKTPPSAN